MKPPQLLAPDSRQTRQTMQAVMASSQSAQLLWRLACVLLVTEGHSTREVSAWLGASQRSVERWHKLAAANGLACLASHHGGGRSQALSTGQLDHICSKLKAASEHAPAKGPVPAWSGKTLARHIQQQYGLNLSVRTCQRVLARLRVDAQNGSQKASQTGPKTDSKIEPAPTRWLGRIEPQSAMPFDV